MLGKIRKIHFVGIGGIGMSGIAELLLNLGFTVSGSDLKPTPVTERLARLGAKVYIGHEAAHVQGAQVVVVSSAIPPRNPEIVEAERLQIPVIPRAEMLAELMRLKFSVAVAGAHGKTTTTSMIAIMLTEAGLDPTAVIGGRLDVFGSSARLGKGELMVVEADESDRSFLLLLPSIAVVTNIDREHLDHYRDFEEIVEAFVSFMNKTPFYGAVIACADLPWRETLERVRPRLRRRLRTYGLESGSEITAQGIQCHRRGSSFRVCDSGKYLLDLNLAVPGRHNVQNALAAVGVGLELGLSDSQIRQGLERFHGADRRFQVKAEVDGITVVDDYGHHPAEIRATLEGARAGSGPYLGHLSTASLHAHPVSDGRLRRGLRRLRACLCAGYLSCRRGTDPRHHFRAAGRADACAGLPRSALCGLGGRLDCRNSGRGGVRSADFDHWSRKCLEGWRGVGGRARENGNERPVTSGKKLESPFREGSS